MIGIDDTDVPQIKLRPLDSLVAYARNARTHSPAQVKQLQGLLLEFGWTNAVLMDKMGIVAGHGRCLAAAEIYKQGKQIKFPNGSPIPIGYVPTLDCTGWSDLQRKAYILADNKSALTGGWNEELLALELKELSSAGYDMALTAFDDVEVAEFLAAEVKANAPADPEIIPDVAVSRWMAYSGKTATHAVTGEPFVIGGVRAEQVEDPSVEPDDDEVF